MTRSTAEALAIDRHHEFHRAAAQARMTSLAREAGRHQANPEPATNLIDPSVWLTAVAARRQPT
jgi:hypothetical protein